MKAMRRWPNSMRCRIASNAPTSLSTVPTRASCVTRRSICTTGTRSPEQCDIVGRDRGGEEHGIDPLLDEPFDPRPLALDAAVVVEQQGLEATGEGLVLRAMGDVDEEWVGRDGGNDVADRVAALLAQTTRHRIGSIARGLQRRFDPPHAPRRRHSSVLQHSRHRGGGESRQSCHLKERRRLAHLRPKTCGREHHVPLRRAQRNERSQRQVIRSAGPSMLEIYFRIDLVLRSPSAVAAIPRRPTCVFAVASASNSRCDQASVSALMTAKIAAVSDWPSTIHASCPSEVISRPTVRYGGVKNRVTPMIRMTPTVIASERMRSWFKRGRVGWFA